jgi:4-hydroxybenzoate polyprenyltransferase
MLFAFLVSTFFTIIMSLYSISLKTKGKSMRFALIITGGALFLSIFSMGYIIGKDIGSH